MPFSSFNQHISIGRVRIESYKALEQWFTNNMRSIHDFCTIQLQTETYYCVPGFVVLMAYVQQGRRVDPRDMTGRTMIRPVGKPRDTKISC